MRLIANIIIIGAIVIFSDCEQSNNTYCGNSERHELPEIKKFDIYRETTYVKLGSFKLDPYGNPSHLPMKNGEVDVKAFFELRRLNDDDRDDIFGILANYDFSAERVDSIKKTIVFCYNPRNSILFFDNNDAVIGYVELCFECFGYRKRPSSLIVGEFCDEKFEIIKDIFTRSGIEYGITTTSSDDQLEYLTKELKEHPNDPLPLISIAKLKTEVNDFSGAIDLLDRAIRLDSTNRHAYFFRGHSKLKSKDFDGAIKDFDQVITLDSNVTQAYRERAVASIAIFEVTNSNELLIKICKDLSMVQQLGDSSVAEMQMKYCEK